MPPSTAATIAITLRVAMGKLSHSPSTIARLRTCQKASFPGITSRSSSSGMFMAMRNLAVQSSSATPSAMITVGIHPRMGSRSDLRRPGERSGSS